MIQNARFDVRLSFSKEVFVRILITGATGLIGRALAKTLLQAGHELTVLGRSSPDEFRARFDLPCDYHRWKKPEDQPPPDEALQNIDGVVHLAGESIADGRWSETKKRRIYDSRVKATRQLAQALKAQSGLKVVVGASAIGFYGDRGEEFLTEASPAGSGFLAETCRDWEKAWAPIEGQTRVVRLRTGIVLAREGGFLSALEPIFKLGLGGPVGCGRAWMSWIHIDDLVSLIVAALADERYGGPLNGVAPNPERNRELTRELARALKRPAFLPVPTPVLKIFLGEKAALASDSQRVAPQKALVNGFVFKYPRLPQALEAVYPKKER